MTPSPEEVAELRESFSYNDANADGRIEFDEFVAMLDQLDAGMTARDARIGFGEIDADDDGVISFDEFVAWWRSP